MGQCCCAITPPSDDWIGRWEGDSTFLTVKPDGKFIYAGPERQQTGYMFEYDEHDRTTSYVKVGGCLGCISSTKYLVQKEPTEESGNWEQKAASKQFTAQTKWRCIVNKHNLVKK